MELSKPAQLKLSFLVGVGVFELKLRIDVNYFESQGAVSYLSESSQNSISPAEVMEAILMNAVI